MMKTEKAVIPNNITKVYHQINNNRFEIGNQICFLSLGVFIGVNYVRAKQSS